MAVRAAVVHEAPSFVTDLKALAPKYPQLRQWITDWEDAFRFSVPHVAIDPAKYPGVHFILVDYPPLGDQGLSLFIVTYHILQSGNPMSQPWRTFTMLTITERP